MMSVSKDAKDGNIFERALKEYVRLLQQRPVLTKSVTNACVSALGTTISQLIAPDPRTNGKINWRSVFAYTSFGFVVNGPLIHHMYAFMEKHMPRDKKYSAIKRLLFDRLIFAPPFLLIFLYYVAIVEGAGTDAAIQKIKDTYWTILKLNWTVWTGIQYINVNYIPLKFRTVFGNACALIYLVVVTILRRRSAS
ncbi:peroxisomal membrane protein 2-like [Littorina saxatilis]|uniref:Peroxisomal membrane protein 2 n=1 Tax=Littorina saxatilis TaxID=31220 RepID=A0AAN9FYE3_9CAEN